MSAPILRPHRSWHCPNCRVESITHEARPHSQWHRCRAQNGLRMPMVEAGTKAKIELREREDYVAGERVFYHQGRPLMSIVTTRDNGQDCAVFAPAAVGSVRAG